MIEAFYQELPYYEIIATNNWANPARGQLFEYVNQTNFLGVNDGLLKDNLNLSPQARLNLFYYTFRLVQFGSLDNQIQFSLHQPLVAYRGSGTVTKATIDNTLPGEFSNRRLFYIFKMLTDGQIVVGSQTHPLIAGNGLMREPGLTLGLGLWNFTSITGEFVCYPSLCLYYSYLQYAHPQRINVTGKDLVRNNAIDMRYPLFFTYQITNNNPGEFYTVFATFTEIEYIF